VLMKPRQLLSLDVGARTVERRVLKPAISVWAALAVVMICLGLYDVYAPVGTSPVARFFKHRVNLASKEWKATELVAETLPPAKTVEVETDNRAFFYLLRYRLCPAWVLSEREMASWRHGPSDSIDVRIVYRKGVLRIEEPGNQ